MGRCGSGGHAAGTRSTRRTISTEEYPFNDRTFSGGFSPDGREFATGAHSGDALMVHSFPSGHVVASIESEALFAADDLSGESPDDVGYQIIILDDDHLLAETGYGRMILLDRRRMRLLGTVWPTGCRLRGYDEHGRETDDLSKIVDYETGLSSLHPAGTGKVLTVYDGRIIRLLDVSPLLSAPGQEGSGHHRAPADGNPLIDGDMAFRQHGGGHTPGPNRPTFVRFASRYIMGPPWRPRASRTAVRKDTDEREQS
jgi:hypothetical protein